MWDHFRKLHEATCEDISEAHEIRFEVCGGELLEGFQGAFDGELSVSGE
jgi:hypothetical protein